MLKRWCLALALASACAAGMAVAATGSAPAVPAAAAAPKGSLVIIGGGLRANNAAVWNRIVALAGGRGARIAVLATAALNPQKEAQLTIAMLNRYGARAFAVPVAPRLGGGDDLAQARRAADDPALAQAIAKAGGVFFTGGDQARITGTLRRADGSNTAVLDALWALYRRGGVIAGTSAGAAIMSATMFADPPLEVIPVLKNGVADGKDIAPGLGFIGDDVFVDQHLLVRGRFGRMLPAMLAKGYTLGLGIDEDTAAVVGPGRQVTVIGYRGALVLDLLGATTDKTKPGLNLQDARISYLDNGDRFDIGSRTYHPGPDKEPVNRAYVEHRAPIFFTDILGNTGVVNLLEKLADSDLERAVGVAFEGPDSAAPERGFEFTFTRVPDTKEYVANLEDAYSIYRVRMDVRPVRVHQPFYSAE